MPHSPPKPLPDNGPAGGLLALFEHNRHALRRFLAARTGSAADAEDCLQELWIKLEAHSCGPIANGRAYLFRMANNLVLDLVRGRQRAMARDRSWLEARGSGMAAPELTADPAPDAEARLLHDEELRLLDTAIAGLPPGARRALILFRVHEMGQADIAQAMGISRSGVEKHLALAMRRLRENLRERHLLDCGSWPGAASGQTINPDGGIQTTEGDHGG